MSGGVFFVHWTIP